MADSPRFSVTIPAYNAEETLVETVESVMAQTSSDWELVITDDGSTDGTLALARALAGRDERIVVVSQENRGSGGAYNTAVRTARSELLVMLSADDLLMPDHLASLDEFIRGHAEASVFTCDGWYQYEDGRRESVRPQRLWADPQRCTLEDLMYACFYCVGAVYRRDVFDAVGGFREDLYAEDYLFYLLALARGFEHRHLGRSLSVHRRHAVQKSSNAILMRETDLLIITELVSTDLLTAEQRRIADRSASRLRRGVRARKTLGKVIGPAAVEWLASATREMRMRFRV